MQILKETKARHTAEGLRTDGYPVIVWLHGYRINGNVQEDLFIANALNSAIMGINGTNLEDYDAFSWDLDKYPKIHDSIQEGLDELAKTTKIDRKKVYVYGFSQGGAAATRMLATYPKFYQGGLIVAPSYFDESLPDHAQKHKIALTHGKSDFDNIMQATKKIEPAFKKNNTVKYVTYEGKQHLWNILNG